MSKRTVTWLTWSLWLIAVGLAVASLLGLTLAGAELPSASVPERIADLIFASSPVVTAAFGLLIAQRRPRNPVGWLLGVTALAMAVEVFVQSYANYALKVGPDSVGGAVVAAWIGNWLWAANRPLYLLAFMLFPNGRLLSARWRPLAWLVVAVPILIALVSAVYPGPLYPYEVISNPVGLPGSAGDILRQLVPFSSPIFSLPGLVLAVPVASLVVRFRWAQGEERQQLKWLAFAGGLAAAAQVLAAAGLPRDIGDLLSNATMTGLAGAIAVAILWYRLYDIDLIIRRTVVYGVLTGSLAAVYVGSVVLLQGLFRILIGQGTDVAIVASTLAIAALFQPLRHRIQRIIDRRFYRQKYDAARTLASFSASLRDEVDLAQLSERLTAVVEETMRPTRVALWLRPANKERRRNVTT